MGTLTNRTRIRCAISTAALALALALASEVHAQSSASAFTSATRYDDARRVTGTIAPDPDGSGSIKYAAVRNTYDNAGRLTKTEKGELSSWQSESVAPASWSEFTPQQKVETSYDTMSRKVKDEVYGWNGSSWGSPVSVTQYSYDSDGRPECTAIRMNPAVYSSLPSSACTLGTTGSQGDDRITRNYYDPAGQLVKVRRAIGTTLEQDYANYGYTANGKQASLIDASGNKSMLTYDGFDRQARWYFPSKTTPGSVSSTDYEEYGYDANGNRTSLRKRDASTIGYSYDLLNRASVKDMPGGSGADAYYGYDLRGLQTVAKFGSISGQGVVTAWDGFGSQKSSTTDVGGTSRTLSYQYDADGNRTRVTHPDSNYFGYSYDGLNRMDAVSENGSTTIAAITYNAQGTRANHARGGVTITYGHDDISRLSNLADNLASIGNDVTSTFAYNPASQVVTRARDNDSYAFSGYSTTSKSYTANGLNQYTGVAAASLTYDDNGNLTSDGTTTYTYDVENRLITASGGVILTYDPLGRLYETVGVATTRFLYDGDELVAEYNSAGTLLRRYVHGTGDDDPMIWYEGSGLGTLRSLQTDHQGSVVSVADSSGSGIQIDSYDEYGNPGSSNIGRFQYTGQAWLPELGMYHYKARIYSPVLGRFMQTDPIGYEDDVNLYAYVGNNPMNGRDPSGTSSLCEDSVTPCYTWDAGGQGQDRTQESQKSLPQDRSFQVHKPINDPPLEEDWITTAVVTGLAGLIKNGIKSGIELLVGKQVGRAAINEMSRESLLSLMMPKGGALNMTPGVAAQLAPGGVRSYISTHGILDAVRWGRREIDPQGAKGHFMYFISAARNMGGKKGWVNGALELLVYEPAGQVRHALFRSQ